MSSFTREINRLLFALLLAFGVMILAVGYYAVIGHVTLLSREDNPRLVEAQRAIARGSIYDRDGVRLAQSTPDEQGFAVRDYLHPSMYSALGYYSYRYGAGGVEAAYDPELSGSQLRPTAAQVILGQPVRGVDIRLTLDLDVQQALHEAMGSHTGAAVVMAVPSGEILGLVSQPTFNPNTLDADWESLITAPGDPFFNRVLQGRYQPGTLMQTPIIIAALLQNQSLNAQFLAGSTPVELNNLEIACVARPPQTDLTLREAYLYGCPLPFAQLAPILGATPLRDTFDLLQLGNPPFLVDFSPVPEAEVPEYRINRSNLRENVLGQGELNVAPIGIATLTAAMINSGNAPQPRIIGAVRPPGETEWQIPTARYPMRPFTTAPTARRVSELLRASAQVGTASSVAWAPYDVGGQAAVAYTGEGTLVWFTGFVILEMEQNAVITVVLEDTANPAEAVEVAYQAVQAVTESFTAPQAN